MDRLAKIDCTVNGWPPWARACANRYETVPVSMSTWTMRASRKASGARATREQPIVARPARWEPCDRAWERSRC